MAKFVENFATKCTFRLYNSTGCIILRAIRDKSPLPAPISWEKLRKNQVRIDEIHFKTENSVVFISPRRETNSSPYGFITPKFKNLEIWGKISKYTPNI